MDFYLTEIIGRANLLAVSTSKSCGKSWAIARGRKYMKAMRRGCANPAVAKLERLTPFRGGNGSNVSQIG